ncbi:MAG: NADPH-dependent 7-cyano-7-deazaguanine reductase QueF [Marinagarivorans sp.]|nr:NADPH-dependent 7-cyano-7-deazaguanine reductase QueF [Marinagarivorans sp.]
MSKIITNNPDKKTPNASARFGDDLGLGKHQDYPDQYNPELLQPIARELCRQHLPQLSFKGVDIWTGYELSWLDEHGKPKVAIAEFSVPAESTHIIESKSFKYYLNSFNQTRISQSELINHLSFDLSEAAGAQVNIQLFTMDQYQHPPSQLPGFQCVDNLALAKPCYQPNADFLQPISISPKAQQLCSHLLKSNCPVTGQPDWASLWISIEGVSLKPEDFLAYVVSFRGHQDFHENCVEQIYCDLWQQLSPSALWVYARYTRRGGLDINPFRSNIKMQPPKVKGARQ